MRTTRRSTRVAALAAIAAALLIGVPVAPVEAADNLTAFTIDTQPDGNDPGTSLAFTDTAVAASLVGGGVEMTAGSGGDVYVAIIQPPTGQTLAPGAFTTTLNGDETSAGLSIEIPGEAPCSDSTGSLDILEVSLGVDQVTAFAATYTDWSCDGSASLAFGELRYNSAFDYAAASTSPSTIDFPDQAVARPSAPVTVTVTNDGSADLTLGTAGFSGADPEMFSKDDDTCSDATLTPGTPSCTIDVTFEPGTAGPASAQLDIPDDTALGTRTVLLSGNGITLTSEVTITTSAKAVAFGKSVQVTANLAAHEDTTNQQLTIFATPFGGTKTPIETGDVDSNGDLSFTYKPTKKTTFEASFDGDGSYTPATSGQVDVDVVARVVGRLARFDARSGRYKIYGFTSACPRQHRRCPTYAVSVSPNHAGKKVSFVLQLFASGRWQTATTVDGRLGPKSTRVEIFVYKNASIVGLPTRVRVRFGGDADHLGRTSKWSYFKVVR